MFDDSSNKLEKLDDLYNFWANMGVIEIGYPPEKAYEFATFHVKSYMKRHKIVNTNNWVAPHQRVNSGLFDFH